LIRGPTPKKACTFPHAGAFALDKPRFRARRVFAISLSLVALLLLVALALMIPWGTAFDHGASSPGENIVRNLREVVLTLYPPARRAREQAVRAAMTQALAAQQARKMAESDARAKQQDAHRAESSER
jgi:hypothetical protein